MAHNIVITLALLLEVVARRALAATVVVAPPSSTGSPGLPGTQFDEACEPFMMCINIGIAVCHLKLGEFSKP